MKKKGFTLMELLAVVVILAIISLIATPVVINIIEKAKMNSFKSSIYGLMEATDLFLSQETYNKNKELNFACDGKTCTSLEGYKLSTRGKIPKSGSITVKEGIIEANYIKGSGYCALGTKNNLDIKKDCDKLDATEVEVSITNIIATTNSIMITLNARDMESGIKKIEYYIEEKLEKKEEYENHFLTDPSKENTTTVNNTYVYTNLKDNSKYKIVIKITNGNDRVKEEEKEVETKEITNPVMTYTNTPESEKNGYYKRQEVEITYINRNIENARYYVKTTKEGKISASIVEECGNGEYPSNCGNSSNITKLEENKWYKVNGNIKVIYDETREEEGYIYAITNDGVNNSGYATGTISKIDGEIERLELNRAITTKKSIIIPITFIETKSGKDRITSCKIGNINGEIEGTSACKFTNLEENNSYTYEVCVRDLVGNSKCETGSTQTGSISGVISVVRNEPEEEYNGYRRSQKMKATFTNSNITNPSYYIKTTREGKIESTSIEACGTGTEPGSCNEAKVETTLLANTWYKVENSIEITYEGSDENNGYLYAVTYDGEEYVTSETYTLSKIERENPRNITITPTSLTTEGQVKVDVTAEDTKSGINRYEIYYGESTTSLTNKTTITTNLTSTTTTLNLEAGKTYYFKVRVYDNVGNYEDINITSAIKTCKNETTYQTTVGTTYKTTVGTTYKTTVVQKSKSTGVTVTTSRRATYSYYWIYNSYSYASGNGPGYAGFDSKDETIYFENVNACTTSFVASLNMTTHQCSGYGLLHSIAAGGGSSDNGYTGGSSNSNSIYGYYTRNGYNYSSATGGGNGQYGGYVSSGSGAKKTTGSSLNVNVVQSNIPVYSYWNETSTTSTQYNTSTTSTEYNTTTTGTIITCK